MIPATGSPDWKRRVLRQHAAMLDDSQQFHEEQAARYPVLADVERECAAECAFLAKQARAAADAIWPPARGLDLKPVVGAMIAMLDDPPLE